jgi:hypothetical protein
MPFDSDKPGRSRSSQEVWPKWMWVAAPVLVVFVVAGLWWAIFSPAEPGKPTPATPTARVIEPPTKAATTLPTLNPATPAATVALLPTLPPPTPTAGAAVTITVAASPNPTAPVMAIGSKAVVAATSMAGLNVRSGAGTGYPKIKTLPDGAVLEIIGGPKEGDGFTWYQVRDQTGTTGWAAANFMKPQ